MFDTKSTGVPDDQKTATDKIAEGIDKNSTNSPALSIDEKSSKISVVGDANDIKPTSGDYKLTFIYSADDLTEEDKTKMTKNADGDYVATVEYKSRRVKPLYRSKVALLLAKIMVDMNVMNAEGYTTEYLTRQSAIVLADHVEDLGQIARMVLGIPAEQLEYMLPDDLAAFFLQLMENEPNILKEAVGFLGLLRSNNREIAEMSEKQNTAQS